MQELDKPVSSGGAMLCPDAEQHEAFEFIRAEVEDPSFVLTCEHASNRLPAPWSWSETDAWIVETHWAWDPGAARVVKALAAALGVPATLSRFSRLLIDPNRILTSDTLFRDVAEGRAIDLNRGLTDRDRTDRIERYYQPYHDAVDEMLLRYPHASVVSIHSFTPMYEGTPRTVEVGVLFDVDEAWAQEWLAAFRRRGWRTELNQPWSGRNGLMYSPQTHATRHGRPAMELELRQDLLSDPDTAKRLVASIREIVVEVGL